MKTISANLLSHFGQEVSTICTLWTLERTDGTLKYFTDHDQNVTYDGNLYVSAIGYERSNLQTDNNLSVPNMELTGFIDDESISSLDITKRLYDNAKVTIEAVNYKSLADGSVILGSGYIGEIIEPDNGTFMTEYRGLHQKLLQVIGNLYTPECTVDLGSPKCGIPLDPTVRQNSTAYSVGDYIKVLTDGVADGYARYENRIYRCSIAGTSAASAPTYNTSIDAVTVDGGASFVAEQAWTRHAVIASVESKRAFTVTISESRAVDKWFARGLAVFESGGNDGLATEIRYWTDSTNRVAFYLPVPVDVEVGDRLRMSPGCDLRRSTCVSKFDNVRFFRGFPDVPGVNLLETYPDAT